MKIQT